MTEVRAPSTSHDDLAVLWALTPYSCDGWRGEFCNQTNEGLIKLRLFADIGYGQAGGQL